MLSTIEEYLVNLSDTKNKLMPLYEEAFGNKLWLDKKQAITFWINDNPATHETEGYVKTTFWLYVPESTDYKVGFFSNPENGVMESLKDANRKWIETLKELSSNRKLSVAKVDFYQSLAAALNLLLERL